MNNYKYDDVTWSGSFSSSLVQPSNRYCDVEDTCHVATKQLLELETEAAIKENCDVIWDEKGIFFSGKSVIARATTPDVGSVSAFSVSSADSLCALQRPHIQLYISHYLSHFT